MEQKQDYKEKYEKGKLHTRYLFIIAGILAIIGISIALGENSEALGQISMASTVSSIILSSIAIFMSISGENRLNYTQNTLMDTSDRLSNITDNIEHANDLLDGAIDQKLSKLDEISDRLERIGQSVNNVEKEIFSKSFHIENDSEVTIQKDTLWEIYNSMIEEQGIAGKIVKLTMEYLVVSLVENHDFEPDNLGKYLMSELNVQNAKSFTVGLSLGIIKVFSSIGFMDYDTINYFQENMALPQAEIDEIKKFL